MASTFGIAPLIPGLVNEVALEIFLHFVAVDWDGPFTLMLVCTAWRDLVLGRNSLRSLRRNRRGGNPALKENREKAGKGICIVSFDGGGPGSLSQLRMLDELMLRLAFKPSVRVDELRPADYFDLMGGVGFGGLVALLLGRLRMTTSQAMEELAAIGTAAFPEGGDMVTREVNMSRLRGAIESMLVRHGHPVGIKLHDSSDNPCKVILFAAPTVAMDHCHTFRTYLAPRKCLECTFVDAACVTMAIPQYFSSVAIGPRWRKQSFAGIPHGFDNPMREVLKESQLVFGETNPVSLVLSLGSGQRARPSDPDQHVTRNSSMHCDGVARGFQYQLQGVSEYLRLNVDNGMDNIELDDWSKLGSIETFTNVYLEMNLITKYIDKACQWLRQRNGSVTLGQLNGTNADCVVKFQSEKLEDYLKMQFKQMNDIIQQVDIERITLVDAIGRPIRIPIEFCLTYTMLLDVIKLYFKHKKAPGCDFVERGDYRLVHGDRKNVMGQTEWTRIDKAGLKVEMSMILRMRDQNSARCPSCSTPFEGHAMDGWAQCLSCSTQFQIETQLQVEPQVWWEDTTQSEEESLTELVTPAVRESESSQQRMSERARGGEAVKLQFRLISVINITAVPFTSPPSLAGTEGSNNPEQEGNDPTPSVSTSTSLGASTSPFIPFPTTPRWARFNVPDDVFLNPADPVRHELYHRIRQEAWFINQTQERPITGAVTVRCSENDFKKFGSIDCQELDTLPIMHLDYHGDAGSLLNPSSKLDWDFPSGNRGISDDNALLGTIFTDASSNPNPALRKLLDDILASNFLNDQLLEPLLTQAAGRSMVGKLSGTAGYPQICLRRGPQSLYTLFLEQKGNKCLFCGSYKGVLSRAVGCVRKHLGHRPFVCDGVSCELCDKRSNGPVRFYMSSLLKDHIKSRTQKIGCIHEDCNSMLRRGNIQRHWEAMHAGTPFPYDVYSRYTRIESAISSISMGSGISFSPYMPSLDVSANQMPNIYDILEKGGF